MSDSVSRVDPEYRIVFSHQKYDWMTDSYPTGLANAVESLKARLELYEQTGNTEWLVDVANFAMIEYRFPMHLQAHFRATDSSESPGLCGISTKELVETAECHDPRLISGGLFYFEKGALKVRYSKIKTLCIH